MPAEPLAYDGEIWKPVTDPRFDEPLEASSYGRVRRAGHRYRRNGRSGVAPYWSTKKPRIAVAYFRGEYPYVNVKWHGKFMGCPIHIIVCCAFHGDRPTHDHEVAHNDGIAPNVTPDNLRWSTTLDNVRDMARHGTKMEGVDCHLAVLTDDIVREMRALYETGEWTKAGLARRYNVCRQTASAAIRRKNWKHVT